MAGLILLLLRLTSATFIFSFSFPLSFILLLFTARYVHTRLGHMEGTVSPRQKIRGEKIRDRNPLNIKPLNICCFVVDAEGLRRWYIILRIAKEKTRTGRKKNNEEIMIFLGEGGGSGLQHFGERGRGENDIK